MSVVQSLTLQLVSQNIEKNTSSVRMIWTSTQNDSYNTILRTAKYYVSINDEAETEYSVSYTLPDMTTQTIVNRVLTVNHRSDGTAKIYVRTEMDTDTAAGGYIEKEVTYIPPKIIRASTINGVSNAVIGEQVSVRWTPAKAGFLYDLQVRVGNYSYDANKLYAGNTNEYTHQFVIPLSVLEDYPDDGSPSMAVFLHTYSSTGVMLGTDTKHIALKIPENSSTLPNISMTLSPVSSLPAAFDGLYIQRKSKVKATFAGEGKYGATIGEYIMQADGKRYSQGDDYVSDYLTKSGTFTVMGYATDSRGLVNGVKKDIMVIAYTNPKIQDVEAVRCDVNGNQSDSGTYLKISAKRSYSKIMSGDIQKNFCEIRYRYKVASSDDFSPWTTILSSDSTESDKVETVAMLDGTLSAQASYIVQVQAIDTIGEKADTDISIPTDRVYCHRNGARRSFSFGEYVEEDNTFSIAEDITLKVKGPVQFLGEVSGEGWTDLGLYNGITAPTFNVGHAPTNSCYYRVVNGNHVFVSFNCSFSFSGTPRQINKTLIPVEFRPSKTVYAICPANEAYATVVISADEIGYVSVVSSGASKVDWIDGYIDYFI